MFLSFSFKWNLDSYICCIFYLVYIVFLRCYFNENCLCLSDFSCVVIVVVICYVEMFCVFIVRGLRYGEIL